MLTVKLVRIVQTWFLPHIFPCKWLHLISILLTFAKYCINPKENTKIFSIILILNTVNEDLQAIILIEIKVNEIKLQF